MHLSTGNMVLGAIVLLLLVAAIAFGSWLIGFWMGEWNMNDEWCNEILSNPYIFEQCR